eukprot:scaffold72859_cov51-Phaeocystis_antarctica.AAC.1
MEVDGVMMPRPRIPEGPASPGWSPPPLPEPSPGLENWPDHLELLEVEEMAELLASKDGAVPPALLGSVCSRIEVLSGVKAPRAMQQRRVYTQDWLARHSEWTPPPEGFASPPGSARRQSALPDLHDAPDSPGPPTPRDGPLSEAEADLLARIGAHFNARGKLQLPTEQVPVLSSEVTDIAGQTRVPVGISARRRQIDDWYEAACR